MHKNPDKKFRMNIQCKLGYYRKGILDDCRNGTIDMNDTTVCNFTEKDSKNALNFDLKGQLNACERKMYNLNVMCIMETKDGRGNWSIKRNTNWKKYLFLQQFSIDLPFCFTSDDIPENTPEIYAAVSVICILILVFASGIFVHRWQKTKIISNKTSDDNSTSGNTSTDDQWINRSFEMSESEIEGQQITNIRHTQNELGSSKCPDCSILNTLPNPIAELEDILYPRCTVDMEEKLGYGNYGSVLKGYLRMGKAR